MVAADAPKQAASANKITAAKEERFSIGKPCTALDFDIVLKLLWLPRRILAPPKLCCCLQNRNEFILGASHSEFNPNRSRIGTKKTLAPPELMPGAVGELRVLPKVAPR